MLIRCLRVFPTSATVFSRYSTSTNARIFLNASFIRGQQTIPQRAPMSTSPPPQTPPKPPSEAADGENLTQFQKFKSIAKTYGPILIPVHIVCCIAWIGGFYYLLQLGFDLQGFLASVGLSSEWVDRVASSGAGHFAMAYGMYKLIAPFRYAITIALTFGIVRMLPSRVVARAVVRKKAE